MGEVTPTNFSLKMADRSITFPKGIIEDVLTKVDKFIFLVDIVVSDMEEDKEATLILGRPFLATEKALIDVKNGELTLRVSGEEQKFKLYENVRFHDDENSSCMGVDNITPVPSDGIIYMGMQLS